MSLMYIVFVFIHLSLYGMETVDNSFSFNHGSLLKNQVKIEYSTVTGKGTRSSQEDRIAVHYNDFFWSCAVFDGHGGSETSEILADKNNGLLNDLHKQNFFSKNIIKNVYTNYDKQIEDSKKVVKSGSTAVTFTVDVMRQQLFLAHCGDSIGLLIQDKKIVYWTVPHDTNIQTEVERIKEAKGIIFDKRVNGIINLTRSFGDYKIYGEDYDNNSFPQLIIADPEVFETKLQQEKPVIGLLCSDGFTDYFCAGMKDLNSQNIKTELLEPLATIICKLIECGRPISGLAFDLVCLMHWNKSVNKILESIHTNMDWNNIKNESTSWKSYDNVSVVVFEVSDGEYNNADNKQGQLLPERNDLNQENTRVKDAFNNTTQEVKNSEAVDNAQKISNQNKFCKDDISRDKDKATISGNTPKNPSSTITKIFNYAKSLISLKHICFGTLGFCLTAYILKQLYRFKSA